MRSKIYIFHGNEKISREESFATINQRLNLFTEDEFSNIENSWRETSRNLQEQNKNIISQIEE